MRIARFVPALLLLALLAQAPIAQQAQPPQPKSFQYLIYMNGGCIGWVKATEHAETREGRNILRSEEEMHLTIRRSWDDSAFEMNETSTKISLADHTPVSQTSTKKDGNQTVHVTTTFEAGKIVIVEKLSGRENKTEISTEGKTVLTDTQAFFRLKAEGRLKQGEKFTFDKLDEEDKALETQNWTIRGERTVTGSSGKEYRGLNIAAVGGGSRTNMIVDGEGVPIWAEFDGMLRVEMVDTIPEPFVADVVEPIESASKANWAAPRYQDLEALYVHFPFKHDDNAEEGVPPLLDTNSYHEVKRYDDKGETGYLVELKHGWLEQGFKAPQLPMADLPEDVKTFTRPTTLCQSDDKVLLERAKQVVGSEKDSLKAARALSKFVFGYLKKESGATGTASAREAYDEKRGDCTEHSALFVALARAAGLPARNCSGAVYVSGGGEGLWGYHAWSEVWLGRWVVVDATVNEVGTSARYLFFGLHEPGEDAGDGRIGRAIAQKMRPVINGYRLKGKEWQWLKDARFKK